VKELIQLVALLGPEAISMLVDLVRLAVHGASKETVAREAEKLAIRIAFDKAVHAARVKGAK
jgi:hypothetical protein